MTTSARYNYHEYASYDRDSSVVGATVSSVSFLKVCPSITLAIDSNSTTLQFSDALYHLAYFGLSTLTGSLIYTYFSDEIKQAVDALEDAIEQCIVADTPLLLVGYDASDARNRFLPLPSSVSRLMQLFDDSEQQKIFKQATKNHPYYPGIMTGNLMHPFHVLNIELGNVKNGVNSWADYTAQDRHVMPLPQKTVYFNDIFHRPLLPLPVDNWPHPQVKLLAESVHATKQFNMLPILADAIEETTPTAHLAFAEELIAHLRTPNQHNHTRGCWAVDHVLGKD